MKLGQKGFFCVICCLRTVKITAYFYVGRNNPTGKIRIAGESGDCWEDAIGERGEVDTNAQIEGWLYRGAQTVYL